MLALNFNDTHAAQGGAFVQDTWTRDRLTLRYGARFDMFTASYPEQSWGRRRSRPPGISSCRPSTT